MKLRFLIPFLLMSVLGFGADPGSIFVVTADDPCHNGSNQLCYIPTAQIRVCPYSYTKPPYTAACQNPIVLYTDPTLATVGPNPVRVDNLGNAFIFTPPGEYIVQYMNSLGSVIYQQPISSNGSQGAGGGLLLNDISSATGNNQISNGDNSQVWNWRIVTPNTSSFVVGESSPSIASGVNYLFKAQTQSGSTANPVAFLAANNGVFMDPTGLLQPLGTGGIQATTTTLTVNTTAPVTGGGPLTSNLTLACPQCVVKNAKNTYSGGPQDLNASALTVEAANDQTTGTTVNLLAKVGASGAVVLATSDTTVPAFIVDSGAGKSGNALLAITGVESCVMDATASNTAGNYVIASTTNAGQCHSQSAVPSNTFVAGHLISNATSVGVTALVQSDPYFINSAGGGSGTINSGTINQCAYYASAGTAVSGTSNCKISGGTLTIGVAGSTQGILALSGVTSGTTSIQAQSAASGTWTIPAGTDTFMGLAASQTPTNKTFAAEGTGNVIKMPSKAFIPAAICTNTTAYGLWDIGSANQPSAVCAGSNIVKGVLKFARSNVAYISFELPIDWDNTVNMDLKMAATTTDTTNTHVAAFNVQVGCNSVNGTATDDPSPNAAQTLSITNGASQVNGGEEVGTITGLTTTGCSAGYNMALVITRNNSGTDTNTDTGVAVKFVELTFGRAMNASNR